MCTPEMLCAFDPTYMLLGRGFVTGGERSSKQPKAELLVRVSSLRNSSFHLTFKGVPCSFPYTVERLHLFGICAN